MRQYSVVLPDEYVLAQKASSLLGSLSSFQNYHGISEQEQIVNHMLAQDSLYIPEM